MPTLIIVTLVCIALYAMYHLYGPFSYNGESVVDVLINIVAFVLWIGLSAALAVCIIPAQTTTFATTVCLIGGIVVLMAVMVIVLLLFWVFFQWFELAVFQKFLHD